MASHTRGKRPPAGLKPAGGRMVRASAHPRDEVRLGRKNWIAFAVALGVITLGYILLAGGSITLAPLLLVIGYCVLVPYAIVTRDQSPSRAAEAGSTPAAQASSRRNP